MSPAMKRLLVEGAELFHQDCNSIDRLMMYVDNNLGMLNNELCEENFKRILDIVWDNLSNILDELIQSNLEVINAIQNVWRFPPLTIIRFFFLEKKTSLIFCKFKRNFKFNGKILQITRRRF